MKYFIAKYRVSQDALDVLFGALKKAEHEGIEFLECVEDIHVTSKTSKSPSRSHRNGNGAWSTNGMDGYLEEVMANMSAGKSYDVEVLANKLPLKNKYKNIGKDMSVKSKMSLIYTLIQKGKLIRKDGKVMLP